jgi:hypothetical protein
MARTLSNGDPAGYGPADRQLATGLASAKSDADADTIARADGHKDAAAARDWLAGRS